MARATKQTAGEAAQNAVWELEYQLAKAKAATDLLEFAKLQMPDPEETRKGRRAATKYRPQSIHRLLAAHLMEMANLKKKVTHLALSVPPQHGKSQLVSIYFIAWFFGRYPHLHILFATYNEHLALSVGRKVKAIVESDLFAEIFPGFALRSDSKSAEVMTSTQGGTVSFLGRGGSGTGKACDLLIIDDPIKGRDEARSDTVLEALHDWYDYVASSRCHHATRRIVVQTRWAVNDLIGRLCDPLHPSYDFEAASEWTMINVPAVVTDPALARDLGLTLEVPTNPLVVKQFGERPMASLWPIDPERPFDRAFPLEYLASQKRKAPKAFEALYQGNPSPEDGAYFTRDMIRWYDSPDKLPTRLRKYGASDHALSERRDSDPSVVGVVGVDQNENIYVLPDLSWGALGPDGIVEQTVAKILAHKPLYFFQEADLIGKTLGPALRRRMEERNAYTTLWPITSANDKQSKAASIQARMSLGKVYLPRFASWAQKAENELLMFPNGANDDLVDFLGIIGRGLDAVRGASAGRRDEPEQEYDPNTMGWLIRQRKAQERRKTKAEI